MQARRAHVQVTQAVSESFATGPGWRGRCGTQQSATINRFTPWGAVCIRDWTVGRTGGVVYHLRGSREARASAIHRSGACGRGEQLAQDDGANVRATYRAPKARVG